jgi:hypothetical protein
MRQPLDAERDSLAARNRRLCLERDALLNTLRRIAAGDPSHSQFAVLAIAEAKDAIEAATGERP